MSFLSGRKFLIIGGNGFVGNRVAAKIIQHHGHVSVLSRHGPRFNYPENKKINWIIGDVMDSQLYKDKINQADTIIHSMGALFDTSITKLRKPGQLGTYQQMNRDSFLKVLNVLNSQKKVIYLSSVNPPPFLHRYISTKMESQDALFNTKHEAYSIRPGFIYDWNLKKWSIVLRYAIKGWNKLYPHLYSLPRGGTILQKLIKQFEQSQPSNLDDIAESIVYISYKGYNEKVILNSDLKKLSQKYKELSEKQKKEEDMNKNNDKNPRSQRQQKTKQNN